MYEGWSAYQKPGEELFLREQGSGLLVRTSQSENLTPGDVIEVAGFPVMGSFSALLEDAEFRRVGKEPSRPLWQPIWKKPSRAKGMPILSASRHI